MRFSSAKSSGHLTANTIVYSGKCFLTGVQLFADATNAATLVVYDSGTASTSRKILFKGIANAEGGGGTGSSYETKDWTYPIEADLGIYVVVSGTGCGFVAEYIPDIGG